jgi:hypothetical protein
MKIGIMQPYFLPYIGYFALINAVEKFIYLDDVQYMRRGWVNRNRLKIVNKWQYFTIPVKKNSLTSNINEVYITDDKKYIEKFKESIRHSYSKTPYYQEIIKLLYAFIIPGQNISEMNIQLTNEICDYLEIKTEMLISSQINQNGEKKGAEKIVEICKIVNGDHYINPIGGIKLYSKERFQKAEIKLNFFNANEIRYFQGNHEFIPNLSIVDLLMWNSKKDIQSFLNDFILI